jgi:enoyl-CoA hydratase
MTTYLTRETQDNIAIITLQSMLMPPLFFRELREVFEQIAQEDQLRAVLIQSKQKHFSYGLDLMAAFQEHGTLFSASGAKDRMALFGLIQKLQANMEAVASCPIPVISAIHGWCIGGGLDLISACDIRLCTQDTKISLRETKIAIVADLGSLQRLQPIIGAGNLRELAFTGKDINAARAKEMGLINQICEDKQSLETAAMQMAQEIAQNPPLTVRGVKQVLRFGADKSIEAGLAYVAAWNSAFLASEDLGEAVAAFSEKRPPHYEGK